MKARTKEGIRPIGLYPQIHGTGSTRNSWQDRPGSPCKIRSSFPISPALSAGSIHHPLRRPKISREEEVELAAKVRDRDYMAHSQAKESFATQSEKVNALKKQIDQAAEKLAEGIREPLPESGRTAALAEINRREAEAAAARKKAAKDSMHD